MGNLGLRVGSQTAVPQTIENPEINQKLPSNSDEVEASNKLAVNFDKTSESDGIEIVKLEPNISFVRVEDDVVE